MSKCFRLGFRGYSTASNPAPTMSTLNHPWRQNPDLLGNTMGTQKTVGPWSPSKYPEGAIFKDADPLPYLKYNKRVKQSRFPCEYGRRGRPGCAPAPPRSLFPHTYLGMLRGLAWKNPFRFRIANPK
ncbi:hypothetical protein XU18_2290 [Perkinsela sp. CCAP 1560/4]|nr:hypothetical protein XU18_2290 [Perkinsela sp. CCAP 1560/4]|eukprot:KNH07019.1 hypothetical protein XU18_2290 [Perkinsela sp. CCAP 1560/4]